MQPVETQKGVSTKSQLLDSLEVYLNNKNRLQPIIGLRSIIECVNAGAQNKEALYLCEVCVCRLSKADIRNHIMGSLHRYNYIKAWHPHLVSEWKEKSDLSKLAWPLMEKAKILEGKEGPGDVWLLEVEDALYQKMTALSEDDATTLINILRYGQGESESESRSETASVLLEHYPVQSDRIVLLGKNQERRYKNSIKTSAETNQPPSLIHSTVAPSVKSEDRLNNTSTSLSDINTQMSPEPSVISEKSSSSCLDGYTGTEPLIGLFRVVECRGEDGNTYCFLCHCCRIRSNKKDIIDHLTSSSHIRNYLMETHPDQVEMLMEDNYELLQSLAKKVEEDEGRGELKVVNAPESLCIVLTGKSYHWCIKMLCKGWTHTNNQKRKIADKGQSVNKTSNQGALEKCAKVLSEYPKRMTKRKMRKRHNPVFKVSLPITKGSVLLERTSFSMDTLPVISYSPPSDSDLIPSQESQSEDSELDCDTGSEHTSQLQPDVYGGDADTGEYMEGHFVSHQQEADCYFSNNECRNQSEYMAGTNNQRLYGEINYNRQHSSQESSWENFYKEWQKGPQTQNEWLWPAVSHTQDWSSYNSSYGRVEGGTGQWYYSTPQSDVGTGVEMSKGSGVTQYDNQQQPPGQYMAWDHTGLLTGSVGHPGLSGEVAPHLDAAWVNMRRHSGDSLAYRGNTGPEQSAQFLDTEQRRWQTPGHFQTAPQSYMMQPAAYQAIQVAHGLVSNPDYNTGPKTNPGQHFPHPTVIWNPR